MYICIYVCTYTDIHLHVPERHEPEIAQVHVIGVIAVGLDNQAARRKVPVRENVRCPAPLHSRRVTPAL